MALEYDNIQYYKNQKTGDIAYPITVARAVYDLNGIDVQTRLDEIQGASANFEGFFASISELPSDLDHNAWAIVGSLTSSQSYRYDKDQDEWSPIGQPTDLTVYTDLQRKLIDVSNSLTETMEQLADLSLEDLMYQNDALNNGEETNAKIAVDNLYNIVVTTDENIQALNDQMIELQDILANNVQDRELIADASYKALPTKEFKLYYVAKDLQDVERKKVWKIYLRNQLIGIFESSGVTLPIFPLRFPFRFASRISPNT